MSTPYQGFESFSGIELIPANTPASAEEFAHIFGQFNPEDLLDPRLADHVELRNYTTFPTEEGTSSNVFLGATQVYKDGILSSRSLQAGLPVRPGKDACVVTLENVEGQWRLASTNEDPHELISTYAEQTTDRGLGGFLSWAAGVFAEQRGAESSLFTIPVDLEAATFEELWQQAVISTQEGSVEYGAALQTSLDGEQVTIRARGERGGKLDFLNVTFGEQFQLTHISDNPDTLYETNSEGQYWPRMDDLASIPRPFRIQETTEADGTKTYKIESAIEGFSFPDIDPFGVPSNAQETADELYRILVKAYEEQNYGLTRHGAARVARVLGEVATTFPRLIELGE